MLRWGFLKTKHLYIQLKDDVTTVVTIFTDDGDVVKEVSLRLRKAVRAFGCLQFSIVDNQAFSMFSVCM